MRVAPCLALSKGSGLSELTATLLLVVVTLVAGSILYFYLSGQTPNTQSAASEAASVVNSAGGNPATSFYASAEVSANVISCVDSDGTCTIQLTNIGSANTEATGCIFSGGGGSGNLSPSPAQVIAGGTVQVTCTATGNHGNGVGITVTGSIELSNGASVPWTGTWQ